MQSRYLPEWTADAACRSDSIGGSGPQIAGTTWSWMFLDDVASRPDGREYWPDKVMQAMRVCAGCPVRRECLEYAYESEKGVNDTWWSGEPVERDTRSGVFGGVPGRIREQHGPHPDRIQRSTEWFESLALRREWPIDLEQRGNMTA